MIVQMINSCLSNSAHVVIFLLGNQHGAVCTESFSSSGNIHIRNSNFEQE